jgi:hypothetical protein
MNEQNSENTFAITKVRKSSLRGLLPNRLSRVCSLFIVFESSGYRHSHAHYYLGYFWLSHDIFYHAFCKIKINVTLIYYRIISVPICA